MEEQCEDIFLWIMYHIIDKVVLETMKISEEIIEVTKENNITIEILDEEQEDKILACVYQKYIHKNNSIFLWENLKDCSILNDKNGWIYIKDFVKNNNCIMFFNNLDDNKMISVNGGEDLYKILYNTYGFEFYITDKNTQYLICFNHHECLLGCGTAREWIDNLI